MVMKKESLARWWVSAFPLATETTTPGLQPEQTSDNIHQDLRAEVGKPQDEANLWSLSQKHQAESRYAIDFLLVANHTQNDGYQKIQQDTDLISAHNIG